MMETHNATEYPVSRRALTLSRYHIPVVTFAVRLVIAWLAFTTIAFAQTVDPNSVFSDLSTQYDGGVASPTDGSTGNVLQQTLYAAYFWGKAHGGARATVVVSSEYPISGTRILVPGNVDLVCSSYSPHNYSGGCKLYQTDRGNNTIASGSPILMVDYRFGVLPDGKTQCSTNDNPPQPGCTIIDGSGASIRGFTLYGAYASAGPWDIGIRVYASNVHVEDTNEVQFGGAGIFTYGGLNNSFDWNFGTNVDQWWCANPAAFAQLSGNVGGISLAMIDGEASHNQYSTGCAFAKAFVSSLEYPRLAAMNVTGAGNLIQSNLLQADGIGLLVAGQDHRIDNNRIEYLSREAIRNNSWGSIFSNNKIISACLDPNLVNLRPGSLDSGVPQYPSTPTYLRTGYLIMDPNGNVEQVVSGPGTSDREPPDWAVEPEGITNGDELTWKNIGPWKPGLTDATDPGYAPDVVSGMCYAVDDFEGGNTLTGNQVSEEPNINGPSYLRGSYDIWEGWSLNSFTANTCDGDLPDAYGNGQCWWGGDPMANGGPAYLPPNGRKVTASGGGTAWVGDYSLVVLADNVSRHYNNFQGMAQGQTFSVTSSTVANMVDTWSLNGSGQSNFGHPSVKTCTGGSVVITPGTYLQFYYDISAPYAVTQINCPADSPTTGGSAISLAPGNLTFASQQDGTTSLAQTITLTNNGSNSSTLLFAVSDDFSQTNTCGGVVASGASCAVSVTFTPTAAGAHIGALTVTGSGGGASQSVALTGTGSEPSSSSVGTILLSSSVTTLTLPAAGQTATTALSVVPQNGFVGTVNLKCDISALNQLTEVGSLTCAISPGQVVIRNNMEAVSTLVISRGGVESASTVAGERPYRSMSLAGICFISVLSCGWRRRKSLMSFATLMVIVGALFLSGMVGCGYTPTTQPVSYKVVITATTGTQPNASITVPLHVQPQ